MNNTALRAELLSASGACPATTGAERRTQSATGHKESVAYDYTPEQAEAMFAALKSALAEVWAQFSPKRAKENAAFSFSGRTE